MSDSTAFKRCSKCGVEFPATSEHFIKDKTRPGGWFPYCKACHNPERNKRHLAKQTPEQKLKYERELEQQALFDRGLRRCSHCEVIYPATLEYFAKNTRNRHGIDPSCKSCAASRTREWSAENPERKKATEKAYNKTHRAKKTAYNRAWVSNHRAAINAKNRKWRKEHSPNPEVVRLAAQRRRARKLNAEGRYTTQDVRDQYNSQKGLCWWCEKPVGTNYHIDHRIPLSRGGSNWPDNICISCPTCNCSKSDKMPWEWSDRLL